MNEHIDVILTVSKIATRNNPWVHLTTQAFSMGYNVSMLWHYNHQLAVAQSLWPGYMSAEQIQEMKRDRIKHTILLGAECAVLFGAFVGAVYDSRRG